MCLSFHGLVITFAHNLEIGFNVYHMMWNSESDATVEIQPQPEQCMIWSSDLGLIFSKATLSSHQPVCWHSTKSAGGSPNCVNLQSRQFRFQPAIDKTALHGLLVRSELECKWSWAKSCGFWLFANRVLKKIRTETRRKQEQPKLVTFACDSKLVLDCELIWISPFNSGSCRQESQQHLFMDFGKWELKLKRNCSRNTNSVDSGPFFLFTRSLIPVFFCFSSWSTNDDFSHNRTRMLCVTVHCRQHPSQSAGERGADVYLFSRINTNQIEFQEHTTAPSRG